MIPSTQRRQFPFAWSLAERSGRRRQWRALTPALLVLALLVLQIAAILPAVAQQAPPPEIAAQLPQGVALDMLASLTVKPDDLPPAPASILVERILVAPGSGTALGPATANEYLLVEAGTLSVADELGIEGAYPPGSSLAVKPGLIFSYANKSTEPVTLLRLALVPAGEETASTQASPAAPMATPVGGASGCRQPGLLLSAPVPAWPEGDAYVFVGKLTLEAGAELPAHAFTGPVSLLGCEGVLNIAGPSGIEGQLSYDRAVTLPAGVENRQRNAGQDPATALIASLVPVGGQWLAGGAVAAGATPAAIAAGTTTPTADQPTADGALASADVPMFQANASRTGDMPGPGPQGAPILKWKYEAGGEIGTSVVVVDGKVYGATNQQAFAVDAATGEEIWRVKISSSVSGDNAPAPAVDNGQVFLATFGSEVIALDAASGEVHWRVTGNGRFIGSPAIVDGIVFAVDQIGTVMAVNATAGEVIWDYKVPAGIAGSVAIADGYIVFGVTGADLYALDSTTGLERWRFHPEGRVSSAPAIKDGIVYIGTTEQTVHAIQLANGQELWRFTSPIAQPANIYATPAIADGVVYIGTSSNTGKPAVYALDARTGEERWRVAAQASVFASLTVSRNVVYVPLANRMVLALNAENGQELWRFSTGSVSGRMTSPVVTGGVVYVGGYRDALYAIGGDAGANAVTPTPVPLKEGGRVTVTVAGAPLRAAPSPSGVVIAELKAGATGTVTGASESRAGVTWWPVEVDGVGAGFIDASAVSSGG